MSLVDNVDSLEPSVPASELGEDKGASLSKVTDEHDDHFEGLIERLVLFSRVLPVSQDSQ